MRRWAFLAFLLAVPVALVAWIRWARVHDAPAEYVPPQARADAGTPPAAGSAERPPEAALSGPAAAAAPAPAEVAAASDAVPALRKLFQGTPGGLEPAGEGTVYDEQTLFDAINGAAPVYLERKFRRLLSMELKTAGGDEVTCDVFDMTDAEHARAIFEKERSAQAKAPPGFADALLGPMSLVFQRGRFYVKATAFSAGGEAALLPLGRALEERMR